jgi:signal transduction histidine kinase
MGSSRDSITAPRLFACSRSSALSGDPALDLVSALTDPAARPEAAGSLARHWGARWLVVLVLDPELGVLRPAPGFPPTLPGGPSWRALLARCETETDFSGIVAYPDAKNLCRFQALTLPGGTAVVLLDGAPRLTPAALRASGFPILAGLLRAEVAAQISAGLAANQREATERAIRLTRALDTARGELAAQAAELESALARAAQLNTELHELNATLEQRVAERTSRLEEEVRERRKAEAAFAQVQKMEALGQLTGGIAHDFNNLLTVILGGLEMVERALPEDARPQRAIQNAMHAARRAAELTSRMLAFSRRQPLSPKPIDVNRLVEGMSGLLRRALGETIQLEIILGAGAWPVEVDPGQLESALLNLAVNGRDAMPHGGKLTIETGNTVFDEAYCASFPDVRAGRYAEVCVSDSGTGMSQEALQRAFEPFFTTKPPGKGTGLGLSQVFGFIKQSGGHIRIYSELGQGTTVKLYLPRYYGPDVTDDCAPRTAAPRSSGAGAILLVEDDPLVRANSADMLLELGYRVIEADDAEAALRCLAQGASVDLLFTDVVLPGGRSGRDLAEEAARRMPGIRVLYTTGYARNAIVHHGRLDPGVHLIVKPFSFEELAAKIHEVIGPGA